MKKISLLIMISILFILLVSCGNVETSSNNLKNNMYDSIYNKNIENVDVECSVYENINELYDKSEIVIIATPTKEYDETEPSLVFRDTPNGMSLEAFRTVRNINVLKVIKGSIDKSNIDIIENHAYLKDENKLLLKNLAIPMRKDMQYILFLTKANILEGKYYCIITVGQGKYNIDSKDKDEANIIDNSFNTLKNDALKMFSKQIESVKNNM